MLAAETAEVIHRVERLLGTRDVHPNDRKTIREAMVENVTWDSLSPDVQQLIIENEQLPAQSWADPADVPDDL
jgi:hypothetical protein